MVDYLYHYTNLETLKLILENKTFRLSSLNRMDDLEEGETADFQKLGRFIYISSWTNNPNESLLLWNYSKGQNGVRLRMKPHIFKEEMVDDKVTIHGMNVHINHILNTGLLDMMMEENISFMPSTAELIRVTYTNLERLLKPTVYRVFPGGNFEVRTENLGIFKRVEWQEQQEWRYRLNSWPLSLSEMNLFYQPEGPEILLNRIKTRNDLGYIDLQLKDGVFDDFEILCSPYMSDESKLELKELLAQHAPSTIIKSSGMQMRI